MTYGSTRGALRVGALLHSGVRLFMAANPIRVWATATLPLALLQGLLFSLLGASLGGDDGFVWALAGSGVLITLFGGVVGANGAVAQDQWEATQFRIQSGSTPAFLVYLCRALPIALVAAGLGTVSMVVASLVLGRLEVIDRVLMAGPLLLVVALSAVGCGLFLASFGLTGGADVVVTNTVVYGAVVGGKVLAPTRTPEWLSWVFPGAHGAAAMRGVLDGGSVPGVLVVWELLVSAGWLALATVGLSCWLWRLR